PVIIRSPRGGGAVADTRSATTTKSMLPSYWSSQLSDQSRNPNVPFTVTVLSLMAGSTLISNRPTWGSFPPLYSAEYPLSPAVAELTVRGKTSVVEAVRGPLPLSGCEKSREPARNSMRPHIERELSRSLHVGNSNCLGLIDDMQFPALGSDSR